MQALLARDPTQRVPRYPGRALIQNWRIYDTAPDPTQGVPRYIGTPVRRYPAVPFQNFDLFRIQN